MAEVRLEKVSKIFDQRQYAIRDISFTAQHQEFVVLVGPSGCGKTTILRLIAGLEEPSTGGVYIDQQLVNRVPPKDRNVALVFQNYALYPHMTVFENMAFGLKMRRLSSVEIKQRVLEAARVLSIEELLDRKPRQLSGGQRQRVAVGRTIVRKPKVFLFDEPLSNLDAKLRVQMRAELSRLHQKLATTVIYVTHDQIEAMTLGEKVIVLKDGEIQQIDAPTNLYLHPATIFIAGFIGSPPMNLVEGRVVLVKKKLFFISLHREISWRLSRKVIGPLPLNKEVTIGIRPEDFLIQKPGRISLSIDIVEPVSSEVYVYGKACGISMCVRLPRGVLPRIGESISLDFSDERLYLFDRQSGVSLR